MLCHAVFVTMPLLYCCRCHCSGSSVIGIVDVGGGGDDGDDGDDWVGW
jgi:hypothetical protein